jgi:hypothetical protein
MVGRVTVGMRAAVLEGSPGGGDGAGMILGSVAGPKAMQ